MSQATVLLHLQRRLSLIIANVGDAAEDKLARIRNFLESQISRYGGPAGRPTAPVQLNHVFPTRERVRIAHP